MENSTLESGAAPLAAIDNVEHEYEPDTTVAKRGIAVDASLSGVDLCQPLVPFAGASVFSCVNGLAMMLCFRICVLGCTYCIVEPVALNLWGGCGMAIVVVACDVVLR